MIILYESIKNNNWHPQMSYYCKLIWHLGYRKCSFCVMWISSREGLMLIDLSHTYYFDLTCSHVLSRLKLSVHYFRTYEILF